MRQLKFRIKAEDVNVEDGEFDGYLAVFGNEDFYGDIIERGAFTRTIDAHPDGFTLLYQHDWHEPIGKFTAEEDAIGLKIKAMVNREVTRGREALSNLKKKIIDGLSIGYETVREEWTGSLRLLKELKLWEGSVVTFPANDLARVTNVKTVVPFQDLSLADEDRAWDAAAALGRVRAWADATDGLDTSGKQDKYRRAFTWFDPENADTFGAYKLPVADIVEDSLTAVPRGIFAAAAAVQGARGGVDIPDDEMDAVRNHLGRYYDKLGMAPPWEERSMFRASLAQCIGIASSYAGRVRPSVMELSLVDTAIESLQALRGQKGKRSDPAPSHSGNADPDAVPGPAEFDAVAKSVQALEEDLQKQLVRTEEN